MYEAYTALSPAAIESRFAAWAGASGRAQGQANKATAAGGTGQGPLVYAGDLKAHRFCWRTPAYWVPAVAVLSLSEQSAGTHISLQFRWGSMPAWLPKKVLVPVALIWAMLLIAMGGVSLLNVGVGISLVTGAGMAMAIQRIGERALRTWISAIVEADRFRLKRNPAPLATLGFGSAQ